MSITRVTRITVVDTEVNDEYGVDLIVNGQRVALTADEARTVAADLTISAREAVSAAVHDVKGRERHVHAFDRDEAHTGPLVVVSEYEAEQ